MHYSGRRRIQTGPTTVILLFLLASLVGLVVAVDPTLGLRRICIILACTVVLLLFLIKIAGEDGVVNLAVLLVIVSVGAAVLSLVVTNWTQGALVRPFAVAARLPILFQLPGSGVPHFTPGINPRLVGGVMAFLLPLPLAFALFGQGRRLRLLGMLAAAVIAYPMLLSQSPQAFLGVALALVLLLAWRAPRSLLWQLPPLFMLVGAWLLRDRWLSPPLVARLELGIRARLEIWPRAWLMVRDMPFTGIGLNNFPLIDDLYSLTPTPTVHAHDVFLQTALDQGLGGLLAFLVLFALAFRAAWRAYRAGDDPNFQAVMLGCAGGFVAFLGFGLWDAITLGHAPAPALWFMLALAFAGEELAAPAPRLWLTARRRRWLVVGLGLLAAATFPAWGSALALNVARVTWQQQVLGGRTAVVGGVGAAAWAQRAVALDPENSRALVLLGLVAQEQGDETGALAFLQRAVALDGSDYQAHFALGDAYFRAGAMEQALAEWAKAGAAEAIYRRGKDALENGDLTSAQSWSEIALKLAPDHWRARRALARSLQAQGKWQEASKVYDVLLTQFPEEQSPYAEYSALLLDRLDQPDKASVVIEAGLARFGDGFPHLYYLRSRLAAEMEAWAAAEADARRAIALKPENGAYLAWLGDLYRQQEKYEAALDQYRETMDRAGEVRWQWIARQRLGLTYAAMGAWAAAVDAQQAAVDLSRAQGEPPAQIARNYVALGQALEGAGKPAAAASAYRQALRYDAGSETARTRLDAAAAAPSGADG